MSRPSRLIVLVLLITSAFIYLNPIGREAMKGVDSSPRTSTYQQTTKESSGNDGNSVSSVDSTSPGVEAEPSRDEQHHTDLLLISERNSYIVSSLSSPTSSPTSNMPNDHSTSSDNAQNLRNDTTLTTTFTTPVASVHNSASLKSDGHAASKSTIDDAGATLNSTSTSSLVISKSESIVHHDGLESGRNQSSPNNSTLVVSKATHGDFNSSNVSASVSISHQLNSTSKFGVANTSLGGEVKNFSHFFSHIPKTGSSYAFSTISDMLFTDPNWLAIQGGKSGYSRHRACNEGKVNTRKFKARYRYGSQQNYCNLWMSESRYTNVPAKIYTIVREPREHVLSMYFHCLESQDHSKKRGSMMHNLTAWLEEWVAGLGNKTKRVENHRFQCYKPIEHQSKWTNFDPELGKEDLRQKWTIIGDNRQMTKSICMIYIRWNGWVPWQCNCTSGTSPKPRAGADKTDHFDHGVKHHGATYNTTPYQDELIGKLRVNDTTLYKLTQEIMQEQEREIEDEFNVKLCATFQIVA